MSAWPASKEAATVAAILVVGEKREVEEKFFPPSFSLFVFFVFLRVLCRFDQGRSLLSTTAFYKLRLLTLSPKAFQSLLPSFSPRHEITHIYILHTYITESNQNTACAAPWRRSLRGNRRNSSFSPTLSPLLHQALPSFSPSLPVESRRPARARGRPRRRLPHR